MQCLHCQSLFEVEKEDRVFYGRFQVPDPKICPMCQLQTLLGHWPFGFLQKRKCDLTGESIISSFSSKSRFPVYKREHWFSDRWTPPSQPIDRNRPFFDQFYELSSRTPHFHQLAINNVNCDYTDDSRESRNCYLSRSMGSCEDMLCGYRVLRCRDSVDATYCYDLERCYECTYCFGGYRLRFALNCHQCSESSFLYDCRNCQHCFMCWNLRNKGYHILNKPYSKEEYLKKISSLKLNSRSFLKQLNQEFLENVRKHALHKVNYNLNAENCVGNYIVKSKNCFGSYLLEECQDCRYTLRSPLSKDVTCGVGVYRGEVCYQACQCDDIFNVMSAIYSWNCRDSFYIDQCFDSHHLFGCVGLKRRSYCIFNQQYSKEDYIQIVARIVARMVEAGEYGQFFPLRFAYNGYNASLAAFYFPESKDGVITRGGWLEDEPSKSTSSGGLLGSDLPDTTEGISDEFLGKPILCSATRKVFNFIPQELKFYRDERLPLPEYYPEYRNQERFRRMLPLKSREGTCPVCGKAMMHYYPPEWNFQKIACEECYQKNIY